jgi:hypothetical protein
MPRLLRPRFQLNRRLGMPQSRFGRGGEEKYFCSCLESNPEFPDVQPEPSHHTSSFSANKDRKSWANRSSCIASNSELLTTPSYSASLSHQQNPHLEYNAFIR